MRVGALILASILAPASAGAQMYKCVDARGVTHYAEKPIPGCRGAQVDIRASPPASDQPPPGAPAKSLAEQDAALRQRMIAREQNEEADRKRQSASCAEARREVARLSSVRRIVTGTDSKGERVYLEDAEREKRIEQHRATLRGCP